MKPQNHSAIKIYQLHLLSFYQTREIRETLINSVAAVAVIVIARVKKAI